MVWGSNTIGCKINGRQLAGTCHPIFQSKGEKLKLQAVGCDPTPAWTCAILQLRSLVRYSIHHTFAGFQGPFHSLERYLFLRTKLAPPCRIVAFGKVSRSYQNLSKFWVLHGFQRRISFHHTLILNANLHIKKIVWHAHGCSQYNLPYFLVFFLNNKNFGENITTTTIRLAKSHGLQYGISFVALGIWQGRPVREVAIHPPLFGKYCPEAESRPGVFGLRKPWDPRSQSSHEPFIAFWRNAGGSRHGEWWGWSLKEEWCESRNDRK